MSKEHKVRQGECISSIAYKYGFLPGTLWNLSENAELKELRKDPNVLFPGDEVFVPEKREKSESGATDQRHTFRRKGVPEVLRIRLADASGEPRQHQAYVLVVEGRMIAGKTNAAGLLKQPIPPNAREGCLKVQVQDESGEMIEEEYPLHLGNLDPVTEVSGIQSRLANLGFECGPASGQLNTETREAIRLFQQSAGLPETGEPDDPTREKLKELHGG